MISPKKIPMTFLKDFEKLKVAASVEFKLEPGVVGLECHGDKEKAVAIYGKKVVLLSFNNGSEDVIYQSARDIVFGCWHKDFIVLVDSAGQVVEINIEGVLQRYFDCFDGVGPDTLFFKSGDALFSLNKRPFQLTSLSLDTFRLELVKGDDMSVTDVSHVFLIKTGAFVVTTAFMARIGVCVSNGVVKDVALKNKMGVSSSFVVASSGESLVEIEGHDLTLYSGQDRVLVSLAQLIPKVSFIRQASFYDGKLLVLYSSITNKTIMHHLAVLDSSRGVVLHDIALTDRPERICAVGCDVGLQFSVEILMLDSKTFKPKSSLPILNAESVSFLSPGKVCLTSPNSLKIRGIS